MLEGSVKVVSHSSSSPVSAPPHSYTREEMQRIRGQSRRQQYDKKSLEAIRNNLSSEEAQKLLDKVSTDEQKRLLMDISRNRDPGRMHSPTSKASGWPTPTHHRLMTPGKVSPSR